MEVLQLLIVDDEMGIREGGKRALRNLTLNLPYIEEEYKFNIELAASGEEAIEKIDKKNYDIVLLDNKLPGIYGTDVLEYMSKKGVDSLTIMITAFASIETAVAATKHGAYDFLTKPFTPEDLRMAVHKAAKHYILTRMTKKLNEDKKKIRFQFISVLSHELKSPIAAVTNYLKIMQRRVGGEELAAYDSFIERSLQRMSGMQKLIFDLLDLTRIESGEKKRELLLYDIVEIMEECIKNHSEMAEKRGIKIHFEGPLSLEMNVDKVEIEIVINNLISNSIKYNVENGSVFAKIEENREEVIISVRDTGIGISKEDIPKLFKEFSRIKNQDTVNISGSGIGLSSVKKIAELYHGEAVVESKEGNGSNFIVKLSKK